jgi:hypothetical protein
MKAKASVMSGKEHSERSVKAYELLAKLMNNIPYAMAWLSKGRTVYLVVDHPELKEGTPEMLGWWW